MGKLLKIIFSIVATVILLVIILAASLPFVVDHYDFKPKVEAAVKDATGRTLTISGDLELSVFPWLGLSTGKLVLSNPDSFSDQPFAEIEESNIKVKVLPLLSKQIEVNRIVLKGLSLHLEKNTKGISNWDDLAGAGNAGDKIGGPILAALAIGGISLENGQIIWDDRQSGNHTEIRKINLKTDRLAFNEPIGIHLSFSILNDQPAWTEKILLTTDLLINEQQDLIELQAIKLDTVTEGESVPGGKLTANLTADIAFNRALKIIKSDLQLTSGDLIIKAELTGKNLDTNPFFTGPVAVTEFSPRKWMKKLGLDVPPLQDSTVLERLAIQFDLMATSKLAQMEGIEIHFDDSVITGTASINNFDQPVFGFDLDVDTVDIDRYLVVKDTGEMRTEHSKKKPSVATPASAVLGGANMFPVETLRALDVAGTVSIGLLKVNKINLQEVDLKLNAKNGMVESQQTARKMYRGSYSGDVSMNFLNKLPEVRLNEKLTNVQVEPLLRDMLGKAKMTGRVNGTATLHGRGKNEAALKSSLNGQINFLFTDGIIKGFNLEKIIDNGKSILKGSSRPLTNENDQTKYSEIKGTLKITNGLVSNDNFIAWAPSLRVNGKGTADLPSEKLDYKVTTRVIRKEATDTEPEKIEGVPVIIDVGGTFEKPSYTLNINEMIPEKKKKELLDKVEKKFGKDVSNLLKKLF